MAESLDEPQTPDCDNSKVVPTERKPHEARSSLREHAIPLLACILYLLIPLSLATFPGEPHLNLLTGKALTSVQCERWRTFRSYRLAI